MPLYLMHNGYVTQRSRVMATAHRGDQKYHPENSYIGVVSAFEKGADYVEIDIRHTKDFVPVVFHDKDLMRLWNRPEVVSELTWQQLSSFTKNSVKKLAEILEIVEEFPTQKLLIDCADPLDAHLAGRVVATLPATNQHGISWCGPLESMQQVRDLIPDSNIWLAWNEAYDVLPATTEPHTHFPSDALLEYWNPEFVNSNLRCTNALIVQRVHERGFAQAIWTINTEAELAEAISLGADAVTTNDMSLMLPHSDSVVAYD